MMPVQVGTTASRVFVLFLIMLAVFGIDYLLHPEAKRTQRQMVEELKSIPLPPDTNDDGFTSGYQPAKGRAERTVRSSSSAKQVCEFFSAVMVGRGWHTDSQPACYLGDEGHTLISFHKGELTCRIQNLRGDVVGMKYAIACTWPN